MPHPTPPHFALPAPPQVSHFTPPAASQASHFTHPAAPQVSHFTPPAAPQITHFTPPAPPPSFTFHAPISFHAPKFHVPCAPQISHFTPLCGPPDATSHAPTFRAPCAPPSFTFHAPCGLPPTFTFHAPAARLFGFPGPEFDPFTQIRGFARFGRPSSLNPRPCLRTKRWRTKIRAAHEHLRRAQREGSGGVGKGRDAALLDREAARNRSTQKPFTPPLLEDVEEAEGHDVHLVAGEGPGGPGRGEGAHDTLGYRWATACDSAGHS